MGDQFYGIVFKTYENDIENIDELPNPLPEP
jgi:hypothetical protein